MKDTDQLQRSSSFPERVPTIAEAATSSSLLNSSDIVRAPISLYTKPKVMIVKGEKFEDSGDINIGQKRKILEKIFGGIEITYFDSELKKIFENTELAPRSFQTLLNEFRNQEIVKIKFNNGNNNYILDLNEESLTKNKESPKVLVDEDLSLIRDSWIANKALLHKDKERLHARSLPNLFGHEKITSISSESDSTFDLSSPSRSPSPTSSQAGLGRYEAVMSPR